MGNQSYTPGTNPPPEQTMDLMVDIETMGVPEPNCNVAMVSIAACVFDPHSLAEIEHTFYKRIDLNSGVNRGMLVSESTVEWWSKQSPEAKAELHKPADDLALVMRDFALWLSNIPHKILNVWANDPDFDVNIIRCNMDAVGVNWPFMFFVNRSFRTLKDDAWPNGPSAIPTVDVEGPKHHALTDAIRQAKIVQLGKHELRQLREIRHAYIFDQAQRAHSAQAQAPVETAI